MTEPSKLDIQRLSADKLMRRFTRSGTVVWILVAFALHVVVLGGTSVDYIHGLVDPAWKERQEHLREEARRKARAAAAQAGPQAPAASGPATAAAAKPPATQKAAPGERQLPKELTSMPKPGEIPAAPSSGISIDEVEKR